MRANLSQLSMGCESAIQNHAECFFRSSDRDLPRSELNGQSFTFEWSDGRSSWNASVKEHRSRCLAKCYSRESRLVGRPVDTRGTMRVGDSEAFTFSGGHSAFNEPLRVSPSHCKTQRRRNEGRYFDNRLFDNMSITIGRRSLPLVSSDATPSNEAMVPLARRRDGLPRCAGSNCRHCFRVEQPMGEETAHMRLSKSEITQNSQIRKQ
jgi:hypothetical protein